MGAAPQRTRGMAAFLGALLAASLLTVVVAGPVLAEDSFALASGNGAIGAPDPRVETSVDGTTWEPALIIASPPGYATIGATRWVNRASVTAEAVVLYRVRFTLPAAFAVPQLGVILHADGAARVLLNGVAFGAQAQVDTPANYQGGPEGYGTVDPALFRPGENVLSFAVLTFSRPSALDFIAGMSYELIPNLPPSAAGGGPYVAAEGETIALAAAGADPEGGPLTFAWDLDGDSIFETPGQAPGLTGIDGPAERTVAVRVCDVEPACSVGTASVTVTNREPALRTPAVNVSGSTAGISTSFSDPGLADGPFACLVDWGDGSSTAGVVSGTAVSGDCAASHAYGTDGAYVITVSVTDKDGGTGSATASAVIATEASARDMVADVRATLQALRPIGDDAADRRIRKAIDALDGALDSAGWVDGDHLDRATGTTAFHEMTRAVRTLREITGPRALADLLHEPVDTKVAAALRLAVSAIDDGGTAADLATAGAHLADGDGAAATGRPAKAIEGYRKAWSVLNR